MRLGGNLELEGQLFTGNPVDEVGAVAGLGVARGEHHVHRLRRLIVESGRSPRPLLHDSPSVCRDVQN